MLYPGYSNVNNIFTEGEWFPFKIHNLIQLQDDCYYYVLLDINGIKHFMPAEYYKNYGYKIGDEITCKIDKINCTGRLLLEPKNPFYNEGEDYIFEIINYTTQGDKKYLVVKDKTGNCIEILMSDNEKSDIIIEKNIKCFVKSIRKGELNLELYKTII